MEEGYDIRSFFYLLKTVHYKYMLPKCKKFNNIDNFEDLSELDIEELKVLKTKHIELINYRLQLELTFRILRKDGKYKYSRYYRNLKDRDKQEVKRIVKIHMNV